jgi:hypothetical protein
VGPLLFWVLLVAFAGFVFTLPATATGDGPTHAYYGNVLASLLLDDGHYQDFQIRRYLPPYALAYYALGAASRILPGQVPEQLMIAACIGLFCLGFRRLVRILAGGPIWVEFLVFPFALHRYLFLGFYNFTLGAGLVLWTVAFWLKSEGQIKWRPIAIWTALVAALYLAHPVALAVALLFCGLHLSLRVAQEAIAGNGPLPDRLGTVLWAHRGQFISLLLALAPALLVIGFAEAEASGFVPVGWDSLRIAADRLWRMELLTPHAGEVGRLVRVSCGLAGIVAGLAALIAGHRSGSRSDAAFCLFYGVLIFFVYAWAPQGMSGGWFFAERFAVFLVAFLIAPAALLTLPGWTRVALSIVVTVAAFYSLADDLSFYRRFAEMNRVLVEAPPLRPGSVGAILEEGKRGPVHVDGARYSPCSWSAGHYFRRSKATMLNAPWTWLSLAMLEPREPHRYYKKELAGMRDYLRRGLESPNEVEMPERLDVLIGLDCSQREPTHDVLERSAQRYGLELAPWSTPEYQFYIRPGSLATSD